MDIDLGICDNCGENPATIQLTQLIGTNERNMCLCEECAAEQGVSISIDGIQLGDQAIHFSEDNFEEEFEALDQELHNTDLPSSKKQIRLPAPKQIEKVCNNCGTTFAEFRNTGILGCAECYGVFEDNLSSILTQTHGTDNYCGKNYRDQAETKEDINFLKKELKVAVKSEEFELAAIIRDKINHQKL